MAAEHLKKHPVLLNTQDFIDLCKPLNTINITTFSHSRINAEGEFSLLSNNPNFFINYLDKKYYNVDIHTDENHFDAINYCMWDFMKCSGQTEKMLYDAAMYNFKHIFTMIEHHANGSDCYHFGTDVYNPSFCQNYLNYIDLLKSFIRYINQKVSESPTLSSAYNIKIKITSDFENKFTGKSDEWFGMAEKRAKFIESISIDGLEMPKRQTECARLLVQGATAKEIGILMNISYRTVECYINLLKDKFHVKNKSELIVVLLHYFSLCG